MLRRATTLWVALACALACAALCAPAHAAPTESRMTESRMVTSGHDPCNGSHVDLCNQIPEAPLSLLFPLVAAGLVTVLVVAQSRRRRGER